MAILLKAKSKAVVKEVVLPASKSICNRVLIIDALAGFNCEIHNITTAKDTDTLIRILDKFRQGERFFDVGHAGTTMRFLTAYFCVQQGEQTLTGSERMKQRPIRILVDALNNLGTQVEYVEQVGYPPVLIKDSLPTESCIEIDGGISSQYISALMLIAPYLKAGLEIKLKNEVVSRPYIEMTKNIMTHFGAEVVFRGNSIKVMPKKYIPQTFFVEGDWSGASYWYSIAALSTSCDITIQSLRRESTQGDQAVVDVYAKLGVKTEFLENGVRLSKKDLLVHDVFEYDFSACPDLAQTVVVTCLGMNLKGSFKGLKTLKIKETDRLQALKNECEKLGAKVEITSDTLMLEPKELKSATIDTYDDHRMAMAFAPLSMKIDGLVINDEEVVKKSYPEFWDHVEGVLK